MSRDLRHAAQDYVALRRALGYQLRGYDRLLDDRYKARLGIARLCALPADPGPGHAGAANQPAGVPPLTAGPLPLQPTEIQALLPATDTLTPTLRAATYRTLLGLLAVTGMRVGEALALDRDNVDLRERRLVVRHAKGGAGSWRCTLQPRGSSSPTRVFATSSVGRQRRRGPPPPGLDLLLPTGRPGAARARRADTTYFHSQLTVGSPVSEARKSP